MEFDTTIQSRWKVSLGCFVVGVAAFFAVRLTPVVWAGLHWIVGALICSVGAFFAWFSLAAREPRRVLAWMALSLNLILPGIVLTSLLHLLFF